MGVVVPSGNEAAYGELLEALSEYHSRTRFDALIVVVEPGARSLETAGRIKLVLNKKGKPLGVQLVGHHAGDLLSEWVAVLNTNMRLSTLAGAIHPYPTRGEINKRVVGSLLSEKIFSDKVRMILKLLFSYRGNQT